MPTLFEKIWRDHVIRELGDGYCLLHVDRHLLHDLNGPAGLRDVRKRGLAVRRPDLTFATPDHCVSTLPGRTHATNAEAARALPALRAGCDDAGIRLFDLDAPEQGIVHVIGPELGLTLPGTLVVCGDSHTCTHGGLGAMAWGIGASEVAHVLATQAIIEQRPRTLRVWFDGVPPPHVSPKDMILALIAHLGADGGTGFAVEYAGEAVARLSVEGRMTLCNLSIELGARIGMVAPDDATFAFLEHAPHAPKGERWHDAVVYWRTLASDADARFDAEVHIDTRMLAPQVSWGTSPAHTIAVDERIPHPDAAPDAQTAAAWRAALAYMGLEPGLPLAGTPVQRVFIGSCSNSRLSDLIAAASIAKGRQVAPGVEAWVVPGSRKVMRDAEAMGLDDVFRRAGFAWREPGCSMCVASNGETVAPGDRCVSTSNRNFVGRQGPGARTHLASPAMAAAAAVTGMITDVRTLGVPAGRSR